MEHKKTEVSEADYQNLYKPRSMGVPVPKRGKKVKVQRAALELAIALDNWANEGGRIKENENAS